MNAAKVSWWRGALEVGVYYRARNLSAELIDSIDYSRFSMVCSNGIKLSQMHRNGTAAIRRFAPAASVDTGFWFVSPNKYSRRDGIDILKKETFYLVYGADTLVEVRGNTDYIK